ncbi:MAG TPA: 5'/3'-nucleotidase SurE [candidate division Zixibacteria bacterium]|nr:5'/3'-nucleotidase SurE [candidate division Zixibacteria bacterium]
MAILLVNDDGIYSPGLLALYRKFRDEYDVVIVAPDREQSSVGHAITLSDPVRIHEVVQDGKFFGYAVSGTPADCVKLAVRVILKRPPNLIISGINQGANVGASLIYSGTVSAATEGTMLSIPSIAVSLDTRRPDADFSVAAEFTLEIAKKVLKFGLPAGVSLNINIPALPREKIKGIRITRQAITYFDDFFERRIDPQGRTYYWMSDTMVEIDRGEDSDLMALKEGYISITPIKYNLTAVEYFDSLRKLFE